MVPDPLASVDKRDSWMNSATGRNDMLRVYREAPTNTFNRALIKALQELEKNPGDHMRLRALVMDQGETIDPVQAENFLWLWNNR